MRVILFVHQSSEMYGSDKVLLFLVQGLQATGEFKPLVVLPGTGPLYSALRASGVEVHIAEVAKISRSIMRLTGLFRLFICTLKGVRELDRFAGDRQVALVHSNTLAVLSGAVWALLRRKKHLWHVHEIILSPKLVSKAFPFLVRLFSDRVISNSTLTERWLLAEQPSLALRSVVVFNGLPAVVRPTNCAIHDFRTSVNASANEVVVTLAGRINRMKGQVLLIEAVVELKRRGRVNGLCFVIIGGAAPGLEDLPAQLHEKVRSMNLEGFVNILPFVDDIWPMWFATDIAVVPSTEPESFGMVAVEAMAAGVPVIAAGHGGMLDIVAHNQTGLLFTPCDVNALADAIERLASDEMLRRSFGSAGKKRQRELFSAKEQVDRTATIYKEMVI